MYFRPPDLAIDEVDALPLAKEIETDSNHSGAYIYDAAIATEFFDQNASDDAPDSNPNHYDTVETKPLSVHLLWVPKRLNTEVKINQITPLLASSRVAFDTPASGVQEGEYFDWHGSLSLQPSLEIIDTKRDGERSNNEFFAGIAFATAAAAFIALLQELPAEIRRRKSQELVDPPETRSGPG